MSKQPFLPLFFGDLLASTAEWEGEERSLYLTLLGYQWSLGSLPREPRRIAKLVGWSESLFNQCWPVVSQKFVDRDDRLVNLRLEEHREKSTELSRKNSASGQKGAAARWQKDGERHSGEMANAISNNGERHKSANGVTDGNPSHPIPSHPIPETSTQTSSGSQTPVAELSLGQGGEVGESVGNVRSLPSAKRSRRMPDQHPIEPMRLWALQNTPSVDFDREISKIRDHQFRDAHSDWDAVIRNWLRRAAEVGPQRKGLALSTKFDRAMEELERA